MLRQRIGFYIIALSAMVAFFKIWDEASQNKHVKKVIGSNITARKCPPAPGPPNTCFIVVDLPFASSLFGNVANVRRPWAPPRGN